MRGSVFILLLAFVGLIHTDVLALTSPLPAEVAQQAARSLIDDVALYTKENSDRPGAMPSWKDVNPGEPMLVYSHPGLEPLYYLVPVLNQKAELISVICIDAKTGNWQWYSESTNRSALLTVGQAQALQATQTAADMQIPAITDGPRLVDMPDKKLYWYSSYDEDGQQQEIFVDTADERNIYTDLDTAKVDPALPVEFLNDEPSITAPQQKLIPHIASFPVQYDIPEVPHHYQETSYHCGPASLEMVFDYWGPDIDQTDIGHVANCLSSVGSYATDIRRSIHFSFNSTAILDANLHGYHERSLAYGAIECFWSKPNSNDPDYADRYTDLKTLISSNYPILVLTWYSASHSSGHFRVIKGYNDSLDVLVVHDPWYTSPYKGPNVNFNQAFFVDDLWAYYYRWGLFCAPWSLDITAPEQVNPNVPCTISVEVQYPGPHPFESQTSVSSPEATLSLPAGWTLASGESATKPIAGLTSSGTTGQVLWQVISASTGGTDDVTVMARGLVSGSSHSYSSYSDYIGTEKSISVTVSSTVDFDGDSDVDLTDFAHLQACFSGDAAQLDPDCLDARLNGDNRVDEADLALFLGCMSGANVPADPNCMD